MTQLDVLLLVCETLDKLKIDYMLIGAYAVSFYGRPRTTHDIDLNIVISFQDAKRIYDSFKDGFYVSKEAIDEAIECRSMFNIICNETMDKVDFWIIKDDEFDSARFARRKREKIREKSIFISSPEDTILTKLDWYKKSNIQKHYDDAFGIFQIQAGKLDLDYIRKWAKKLSFLETVTELIKKCNW